MIQQLLEKRDTISYAIACFCIVLALVIGYMFGYQEPATVCAEYIVEAESQKTKALELNQKLTACESKGAGESVLKCKSVCDERVKKALDNYKDIMCDD